MPGTSDTRRLILEAVVSCIEKYGIDKVTTRKIAVEAGTNIASINYHFRSKEELLEETLSMTIRHMMEDVFLAIDDSSRPFEQVLRDVLYYFLSGSQEFPGISRAHLYRAVVERDSRSISAQAMLRVFDRLSERAARAYPRRDPGEIRLAVSTIMSSILFTMLTPDFFRLPRTYRLTSPKSAARLADSYTALFHQMLTSS